jgi:hypothetical protein
MGLIDWFYLPIAALINSIFVIIWQKKVGKKTIQGVKVLSFIFIGSLFNAWGIDVIHRIDDVTTVEHMMQVSLGCWLFISASTSAKHYLMNGWSIRLFWIDCLGDLVGFILMGLIIYYYT